MAFKADIDDFRESLSYKAKKIFETNGANVFKHDPYLNGNDLKSVLTDAGVVFISMNHSMYKNLGIYFLEQYVKPGCLIVDIWNMLGKDKIMFKINEEKQMES